MLMNLWTIYVKMWDDKLVMIVTLISLSLFCKLLVSLPTRHSYYFEKAEEGKHYFYNSVINANVITTLVWGL